MKKNKKIKILVIGSGNIAWHIVSHLSFFKRFEITVINRRPSPHLKQLHKEFKIKAITDWKKADSDTDVFFICSGDSSIQQIAGKIKKMLTKGLVLHTSGTTPLVDIQSASKNTGVFYPLQTFTFGQSVLWQEVPVFIEASNKKSMDYLTRLANLFSKTVIKSNSENRLKLHLAAVIAGNFSNAMYASAYSYLENNLNKSYFNYLCPLINVTAKKAIFGNPSLVQTGPAARNDKKTQQKHLALLKKAPELKRIYKSISKLITRQQKNHVKL